MDEDTFKRRTKQFGLQVIAVVEGLPRTRAADVMGRQLLRCATSVGAYRAACRRQSRADVLAKLAIGEQETDESLCWLEMLVDSQILAGDRVGALVKEANELLAMTVASLKTLRDRR